MQADTEQVTQPSQPRGSACCQSCAVSHRPSELRWQRTEAFRDPSPAPYQQLLISQPFASLAAAQNWDFTEHQQALVDLAEGRFFKGTDGRWHLIPFG